MFIDSTRVTCTHTKNVLQKINFFFLPEQTAIFQFFSLIEVTERHFCKVTLSEGKTELFVLEVSFPAWE